MPTHLWCQKRKKFPKNVFPAFVKPVPKALRRCRPENKSKTPTIKPTIWQDIVNEDKEFENYILGKKKKNLPAFECPSSYIQRVLYPILVPAFEKLCSITLEKDAHIEPVRFFDFLDRLAEYLYNTNPAYMERRQHWKSIHLIFPNSKRPYYPLSWFLDPDDAATMIQSVIRGFLIRQRVDVEEMKELNRKIYLNAQKQEHCSKVLNFDIAEAQSNLTKPKNDK